MATDCPERLDFSFLLYVAAFRRNVRPRIIKALEGYSGRVIHLTTPKEVSAFLEQAGAIGA